MTTIETPTARKARKEALLAKAAAAPKATRVSRVGNPEPAKPKTPKVTEVKMCLCHCGEPTTNRFRQGHDARGKGQLIRWMGDHNGTLAGFPNDELVQYAVGGGFSGRFAGVAVKVVTRTRSKKEAPKAEAVVA